VLSLLNKFSLRVRISIIYVIIMGAGGIITSYVGTNIVTTTIFNQAMSKVHRDLDTARMVYQQQLDKISHAVQLSLYDRTLPSDISELDKKELLHYLERIRNEYQLDFLTLTDSKGQALLRTPNSSVLGDDVLSLSPVRAALSGKIVNSTEIMSPAALENENPSLVSQSLIKIESSPDDVSGSQNQAASGLMLIAASPVRFNDAGAMGALYGGILLNNNFQIVDRTWDMVYNEGKSPNAEIGAVTIFMNDVKISTSVKNAEGRRAVGSRVPDEVATAVLQQGQLWTGRSFVADDWYLCDYEPIRNYDGNIIGILHVGQLEKTYISVRDKVILAFFSIATVGFVVIIVISYLLTRSITRPVSEMVEVTKSIGMGALDREVKVDSADEIGNLGQSFNQMVTRLRKMRLELEEWGNLLEQKVKERTEELAVMQNTLMQSQRLASLGKLAAGIAHEINNPLGGILVLSSLALEDMKSDDPHRENLQEVIKQTMRCRDIVKGLLQFSRQEEGKTEYVQVNDVLNNTLSLIEKQALFHNIEVIKLFATDLPHILGDGSQLQQVFMNIILNAVQAMKEIGVLTITTQHDQKNDMVVIEVTDTGIGIPEQLIDRIFDPFFTTKEVGEGTGLGLAIAYGIVTKHHGRMTVKSKENEGTTFTIKIPVVNTYIKH